MVEQENLANGKLGGSDVSMISDTTSVIDVQFFMQRHQRDLLDKPEIVDEVEAFISTPIPENKRDRQNLLDIGVNLLEDFSKNLSKASHGFEGVFTTHAIREGQLLHFLKKLTRKLGLREWDRWATENLKFLAGRTRINHMKLASRPDCYRFALLGIERLLHLIRATEDWTGNNRIGDFLQKYQIKFNPESREMLKTFQNQVDSAINCSKLEKLNVPVDPKLVAGLTEYRHVFDTNLLKTLETITAAKGDPNDHLLELIINKGKEKDLFEGSKVIQDFNDLGARLLNILNFMEEHSDAYDTIEIEIIDELVEKLSELKTKIINA